MGTGAVPGGKAGDEKGKKRVSAGGGGGGSAAASGSGGARWSCPACTFLNPTPTKHCDVCETPRPRSIKREPADTNDLIVIDDNDNDDAPGPQTRAGGDIKRKHTKLGKAPGAAATAAEAGGAGASAGAGAAGAGAGTGAGKAAVQVVPASPRAVPVPPGREFTTHAIGANGNPHTHTVEFQAGPY